MKRSRRTVLSSVLAGVSVGIAGCTGGDVVGRVGEGTPEPSADDSAVTPDSTDDAERGADGDGPPIAAEPLTLAYDVETLLDRSLSGGVGQDGIPSIDEPQFRPIDEAGIGDGEPVFGVVRNGEAKAYPQYVLVWHEIVNDTIAGEPVAVTYCPLTGTAQGFERGGTEFGVSGQLVNSNLIMYDRTTGSWWPQMVATAISGPLTGDPLREFRVVWTTLGEWRSAYPDSKLLTEETGHARRYGNDPYGEYDPLAEYYASESTLFSPLAPIDDGYRKSVVLGARTDAGAIAFDKATLLSERVLPGSVAVGDRTVDVVAVADPALSTGYVYRNPQGLLVEPDGRGYRVDGSGPIDADDLPLDRLLAFDAMWFAWAGFYPDTEFVGEHTEAGYGR